MPIVTQGRRGSTDRDKRLEEKRSRQRNQMLVGQVSIESCILDYDLRCLNVKAVVKCLL